jgi:GR25 family glycosyltransferase involved in LPS biosynthesis
MLPERWGDLLSAPAFIISMDYERYAICARRARRAGFTNISIFHGVDRESREELETNWALHPFPKHREIFGQHPAAVMLAHLNLWRHVIENEIPYCTIFEDDTLFHTYWDSLAPRYYEQTPKQTDMIFMGHHCGNLYPENHISQVPVYCLNAYIITLDGVRKIYEMITKYPHNENFGVIDMMLVRLQTDIIMTRINPYRYEWYAWNSEMFPDPINEPYKHQGALEKDMGLVFQQHPFFKIENDDDNNNL